MNPIYLPCLDACDWVCLSLSVAMICYLIWSTLEDGLES